jgi:hypothetical protein
LRSAPIWFRKDPPLPFFFHLSQLPNLSTFKTTSRRVRGNSIVEKTMQSPLGLAVHFWKADPLNVISLRDPPRSMTVSAALDVTFRNTSERLNCASSSMSATAYICARNLWHCVAASGSVPLRIIRGGGLRSAVLCYSMWEGEVCPQVL